MNRQSETDILSNIRIEYISDPKTSYRKLAEKYDYPVKKISAVGKKENWKQLRVQLGDKILKKTINRISTEKSDDLAKVIKSTNKLLKHIDKALDNDEQFDAVIVVKETGKTIKLNQADTKAINNMANALRSVFEILKVAESDDSAGNNATIKFVAEEKGEEVSG